MENLLKLKCTVCLVLPDKETVYICDFDHKVCGNCAFESGVTVCAVNGCFGKVTIIQNPLLNIMANSNREREMISCIYAGCTLNFTRNDLPFHIKECQYREFNCIGETMGIWKCQWKGLPTTIDNHFEIGHPEVKDFFTDFQDSLVPFDSENIIGTINLIEAFSRIFVFYYQSHSIKKLIHFAIILIGSSSDAENFYYKFKIKSPNERFRNIKFVENVFNDKTDIRDICGSGRCVTLTHETIKQHLCENNINFRFMIIRKDLEKDNNVESNMSMKQQKMIKSNTTPNLKNAALGFTAKGTMKANYTKRSSSLPQGNSGSFSVPKSTNSSSTNSSVHENRSSINKIKVRDGLCHAPGLFETPCLLPSINRMDQGEEQLLRETNIIPSGAAVLTTSKQKLYKNLTQVGENSFCKVKYK